MWFWHIFLSFLYVSIELKKTNLKSNFFQWKMGPKFHFHLKMIVLSYTIVRSFSNENWNELFQARNQNKNGNPIDIFTCVSMCVLVSRSTQKTNIKTEIIISCAFIITYSIMSMDRMIRRNINANAIIIMAVS